MRGTLRGNEGPSSLRGSLVAMLVNYSCACEIEVVTDRLAIAVSK